MELEKILNREEVLPVKEEAKEWIRFLEDEISFTMDDEGLHTKEHVTRVLIYALVLGKRRGLPKEDRNLLAHAAVYHDSGRKDDGYDTGHGDRAATYYRNTAEEKGLHYSEIPDFIMQYHDRNDDDGIAVIEREVQNPEKGILLYKLFKDADALDRFRLGPGGLDPRYLRTKEAEDLTGFAKEVWEKYA